MMLSPSSAGFAQRGSAAHRRSTRLFYFPWVTTPEPELGTGTTRRNQSEECWVDVEASRERGGSEIGGSEIGRSEISRSEIDNGEQRLLALVRASRGL